MTLTQVNVTGDSVDAAAAWDPLVEQRSEASLLRLSLDQRSKPSEAPSGIGGTMTYWSFDRGSCYDNEAPFDPTQPPRYDPLRPEYGIRRDHVEIRAFWNPGTSLSIGGEGIWDLDGESSHLSAGDVLADLRRPCELRRNIGSCGRIRTAFLDFTFETGVNDPLGCGLQTSLKLWTKAVSEPSEHVLFEPHLPRGNRLPSVLDATKFRDELILGGSLQLLGQ